MSIFGRERWGSLLQVLTPRKKHTNNCDDDDIFQKRLSLMSVATTTVSSLTPLEEKLICDEQLPIVINSPRSHHAVKRQKLTEWIDISKGSRAENLNLLSEQMKFDYKNKKFADVLIRCGVHRKPLLAHRVMLSRVKYFDQLLQEKELPLDGYLELEFKHIRHEVMIRICEYIYTGVIRLNLEYVLDILAVSNEFGITSLKKICCEYIQNYIDIENVCNVLTLSIEMNSPSLKSYCLKFIDKNAQQVLSSKGFLELNEDVLIEIIQRNELQIQEELNIFLSVMEWINFDNTRNTKRIFSHIRFPMMTKQQLSSIVEPLNVVPQDLLLEAYKYHLVPHKAPTKATRFRRRVYLRKM